MIELYPNNLSVCAQKVRIVLVEKNVPWTNRYVSLVRGEQLTPEFEKMNPRALGRPPGRRSCRMHDGARDWADPRGRRDRRPQDPPPSW